MIMIYNETENPMWELSEKNENYLQISNKLVPSFGIEVYRENFDKDKISEKALKTVNSLSDLSIAYKENTVVRFDRWQLTPLIRSAEGDFNTDIILASFDLNEDTRRLINLRNYHSYIYDFFYDYKNHHLFVIFSLNKTVQNACVEVLFEKETNEEGNPLVFLKVFHLDRNKRTMRVSSRARNLKDIPDRGKPGYIRYEDRSIDKYEFKVRPYMPIRLTHCAIITEKDDRGFLTEEIIKENRINPENMIIIEPPEEGEFAMRSILKDTVEIHRTTAITYILPKIKKDDITSSPDKFEEFKEHILKDMYGDFFTRVLVMDGDKEVFIIK